MGRSAVTIAEKAGITVPSGTRVLLAPLEGVGKRLEPKGDGEISMILILEDGATEVEVRLPGKFKVSPQICGAIKAVPGVVDVQTL